MHGPGWSHLMHFDLNLFPVGTQISVDHLSPVLVGNVISGRLGKHGRPLSVRMGSGKARLPGGLSGDVYPAEDTIRCDVRRYLAIPGKSLQKRLHIVNWTAFECDMFSKSDL